jgi:membrane-associated phospholipid phosphatase
MASITAERCKPKGVHFSFAGHPLVLFMAGFTEANEFSMLHTSPDAIDLWLVSQLAHRLGACPRLDLLVQSAIVHNLLGGFWYGAALFVFWVRSNRMGQEAIRRRILTTLFGTGIAILFMLLAEKVFSWPPPMHFPALAHYYPHYIYFDPGANSFPSQSTTLYATVAAGIWSFERRTGWVLWIGVVLLVGLPRIYVGGHYPTDVAAGIVIGLAGYAMARKLFEPRLSSYGEGALVRGGWRGGALEVLVFGWILLIATEFRDVGWLTKLTTALLK